MCIQNNSSINPKVTKSQIFSNQKAKNINKDDNNYAFEYEFTWYGVKESQVYLHGNFTNWEGIKMEKQENGTFKLKQKIKIGANIFKFLADGVWQYSNVDMKTTDDQGNINNYIEIYEGRKFYATPFITEIEKCKSGEFMQKTCFGVQKIYPIKQEKIEERNKEKIEDIIEEKINEKVQEKNLEKFEEKNNNKAQDEMLDEANGKKQDEVKDVSKRKTQNQTENKTNGNIKQHIVLIVYALPGGEIGVNFYGSSSWSQKIQLKNLDKKGIVIEKKRETTNNLNGNGFWVIDPGGHEANLSHAIDPGGQFGIGFYALNGFKIRWKIHCISLYYELRDTMKLKI